MARSYAVNYKKVAQYRVVEDKLSAAMPFATQIIVTDGGPWAEHNVVCQICGDRGAVLDLHRGVFRPCDLCTKEGWRLTKAKVKNFWWQFWRGHA